MKTNKEIIIEELKNAIGDPRTEDYLVLFKEDLESFASSLLSKLNKIDGGNVENIIENLLTDAARAWQKNGEFTYNKYLDQILQLIPEEGEVVARLNIENWVDNIQEDGLYIQLSSSAFKSKIIEIPITNYIEYGNVLKITIIREVK